jgi:4-amino-4-deoxy-L-arabinose transferase-like glycosyltransferase
LGSIRGGASGTRARFGPSGPEPYRPVPPVAPHPPLPLSHASDILAPLSPPDPRPLSAAERLVVAASAALVWVLAWAHPLYPPDEGRFASVAAAMADGGSWIVPLFRGEPHLTKPPLTYWLQAIGVELLGRTALAVRLPSLLATSAALLVLFTWMRRGFGARPAVLAIAVAAVMPLTLLVGRLATTDALLSLAWITMLASAWAALDERPLTPTRRPLAVVTWWVAFAAALLTKGPVALGPVGIVVVWLLLAGRLGDVRKLRPSLGAALAFLPLGAWLVALALDHRAPLSHAAPLWWKETFGRALGSASLHHQPFWFYLAVVLAGTYPASTFLAVPSSTFGSATRGRRSARATSGRFSSLRRCCRSWPTASRSESSPPTCFRSRRRSRDSWR